MTNVTTHATSGGERAAEDRDIPGLRTLPPGVGTKFHADGSVRHFPGNTTICHIPQGPLFDGLLDLRAKLAGLDFASSFTLLPASSWHMTVFEGVCDQARTHGHWPTDLGFDVSLDVCHALFEQRLQAFPLLESEPPYRLRISKMEPMTVGFGLSLEPIDEAQNRRLRSLRDRLSDLLGLRHANHDSYVFHIGLAYFVRYITPEQASLVTDMVMAWAADQPLVELGAPEFCHFENMFHFERQFYLGRAAADEALD